MQNFTPPKRNTKCPQNRKSAKMPEKRKKTAYKEEEKPTPEKQAKSPPQNSETLIYKGVSSEQAAAGGKQGGQRESGENCYC